MSAKDIEAVVCSVSSLFRLGNFVPARVQRDFQWQEGDCEALVTDIEAALLNRSNQADPADELDEDAETFKSPGEDQVDEHYLGSVVLRRSEGDALEIYDGLQRLTSLTILASVLRDSIADAHMRDRLANVVLNGTTPRLRLDTKDDTLFTEIQKTGEAMVARRKAPKSDLAGRLRTARRVFAHQSKAWGEADRLAFATSLLDQVYVTVIFATSARLARRIFLGTNLRGIKLDRVELFKGMLIDLADSESDADLLTKHWAGISTRVGNDMDRFLVAIDFIERTEPQGADCLAELATRLRTNVGGANIVNWTTRLAMYAGAWEQLQQRLASARPDPVDQNIFKLRAFKWGEWLPLALFWYREHFERRADGYDAATARRFDQYHRRCMAVALGDYSDLSRAKIFGRAIRQAKAKRRVDPLGQNGALTFDTAAQGKIRSTLRLPLLHEAQRLSLLRWIEASHWPQSLPTHIMNRGSVEHVLPRNPAIGSRWLIEFPNEDIRFNSCHTLGNLALMDWDEGEKIGNVDFVQKLPAYQTRITGYRSLQSVASESDWTQAIIAVRTTALANHVWQQLQLPPPPGTP